MSAETCVRTLNKVLLKQTNRRRCCTDGSSLCWSDWAPVWTSLSPQTGPRVHLVQCEPGGPEGTNPPGDRARPHVPPSSSFRQQIRDRRLWTHTLPQLPVFLGQAVGGWGGQEGGGGGGAADRCPCFPLRDFRQTCCSERSLDHTPQFDLQGV